MTPHARSPEFLSPYTFQNGLTLRNRTLLAPMTNGQSNDDGTLGADEFAWLESRARGGFGGIVSCAAHVVGNAQAWQGQLGVFSDDHVEGLAQLAGALRREGCASFAQLFHGGVRSPSRLNSDRQPVSASAYTLAVPNFEVPRALEDSEIQEIVEAFAQAARRCWKAGFSGVEIHGANGYLLTQFLSAQSNLRTDDWGGSLENRARFARAILRAIKKQVPEGFVVGMRLSPENVGAETGLLLSESLQVARWLAEDGLDFLHLSLGDCRKLPVENAEEGVAVVTRFREALPAKVALATSGNIWTSEDARDALALGADLVSLGRAAIANPAWPLHAAKNGFMPDRLPMTPEDLTARAVGPAFVTLLRNMRLVRDS